MTNASALEWWWTVICGIALLAALITGSRRTWLGIQALRQRQNGATKWLFIQRLAHTLIFINMTGAFTALGLWAMSIPAPVRTEAQQTSQFAAITFISVAATIALYNVMLVLTDPLIDNALERSAQRKEVRNNG